MSTAVAAAAATAAAEQGASLHTPEQTCRVIILSPDEGVAKAINLCQQTIDSIKDKNKTFRISVP